MYGAAQLFGYKHSIKYILCFT